MQSLPASRRTSTAAAPLRDSDYKQAKVYSSSSFYPPRKFLASSAARNRLNFQVLLVGSATFLFVLYSALAQLTPNCLPENRSLIASLEQWRDPQYAQQKLAVYVYDLPSKFNVDLVERSIRQPPPIRDPRCDTNFYSSEVHVHRFLSESAVRTTDPDKADFFYVPIYTTCDLITHHPNNVERVGNNFAEAMDVVINDYPYFNHSNGRDHVYLFSQGFAARLAGNWERYSNGIFMVHNGEFTAPEFTPHKDFVIPPELRAYFEPFWTVGSDVVEESPRQYLAQFGGQVVDANVSDHRGSNYSGGVRQYMQEHLTDRGEYRITGVRAESYLSDMKNSRFCLSPEGWHPWSPRPYYGVMMGCIPVIISEVQELAFEEIVDWDSFVLWVRPKDIARLDDILKSIPEEEVRRRRTAMRRIWRSLWYAGDGLANYAILRSLHSRKYDSAPRRAFRTQ